MMAAAEFDKQRVAASFSRAAQSYDGVAELQRAVGHGLLERLPAMQPQQLMDLGSGTGYFTPRLQQRYPQARLLSLDLAQGMLEYARRTRPVPGGLYICGDAEALPLASNSLDLIFSSLAIQWCMNPQALFREVARVLQPGGCFLFATLGPETLKELRQAWAAVDGYVHVNRFFSAQELREAQDAQLELVEWQVEYQCLQYPELRQLTDELKGIGAHNMNAGQQSSLTGRERVRRFKAAYEAQRDADGLLLATYEVFYGLLRKKDNG